MDIPLWVSGNSLFITSSHQYQKTDGINIKILDPYSSCNNSLCSTVKKSQTNSEYIYCILFGQDVINVACIDSITYILVF